MSMDNITNYGKSIRSKLLNIAKKEDVFYQTILTRYFQERLLYRLSQTKYRSNFYLKGGALMYAYEKFAARPRWILTSWVTTSVMRGQLSLLLSRRFVPYHTKKMILHSTPTISRPRTLLSSRAIMVSV